MKKKYKVTLGAKTYVVEVEDTEEETGSSQPAHKPKVNFGQEVFTPKIDAGKPETVLKETEGSVSIRAPLRGTVLAIKRGEGEKVEAGEALLVLEAMKMENEVFAPKSGVVKKILCTQGQEVEQNDILIIIDASVKG